MLSYLVVFGVAGLSGLLIGGSNTVHPYIAPASEGLGKVIAYCWNGFWGLCRRKAAAPVTVVTPVQDRRPRIDREAETTEMARPTAADADTPLPFPEAVQEDQAAPPPADAEK